MPKRGEKHSLQTIQKISKARKGQCSPTKGTKKTRLQKEKISVGRKGVFQWIEDKNLSALIKRDFAVATLCFKDRLNKPATVLYCGILEAILRYWLKEKDDTKFEDLIDKARNKGLIGEPNVNKLHTLRNFRNYIHIHRELKGDFELTSGIAQMAQEACGSVIKELQENDKITKKKIKENIEENKQSPTNKKLIFYRDLENKLLEQIHNRVGGELKRKIHFVYGYPERPEFRYTPDGVIKKGNDLIFIEIKHLIDKKFADNVIGNGIQTLKMILEKFSSYSDPKGKIKALLVIVSPHDLGPGYTLKDQDIKVEFVRT